jgi:peptide/nickel transport system permease protein
MRNFLQYKKGDMMGGLVTHRGAQFIGKGLRRIFGGARWHGVEWYLTFFGAFIILAVLFIIIFAPIIAPHDPLEFVGEPFTRPGNEGFIFGTDNLGRDIFSRIIFGSKIVMTIAVAATVLSAIIGIPLGLISGYFGGKLDAVLSLIMNAIYSFPGLILAIALAAMLGPGILNISIAIGVIYIPTYYRVVRGHVLAVKEELYVEAAKTLGASDFTVIARYIFPNVIASIAVIFSVNIADAILTEAGLSFLGLGISPPNPDWGLDLSKGKVFLPRGYWWLVTYPGIMISLVALGFTLLGEGLNEILNPRLKEA